MESETKEITIQPKPENGNSIERVSGTQLGGLSFHNHEELVERASEIAKRLADIIDKAQLFSNIQNRKFVKVEGWTTLGAMLGIVPVEESSVRLEDGSYEATVKLVRSRDGQVVGRASAVCGMDEIWGKRPDYQRKSMAATRATGKAYRLGLSWIMVMAGYDPTPAEEMEPSGSKEAAAAVAQAKVQAYQNKKVSQNPSNSQQDPHRRIVFLRQIDLEDVGPMMCASGYLVEIREQLTDVCFAYNHPNPAMKGAVVFETQFLDEFKALCMERDIHVAEGGDELMLALKESLAHPVIKNLKQWDKNVSFLWGEMQVSCWDKDLWPFLATAGSKPVDLMIQDKAKDGKVYHNCVGIKSIGGQKFDMETKKFARTPETFGK